LDVVGEDEFFVVVGQRVDGLDAVAVSDWIDERVEVEGGEVGIFGFDVDDAGCVVPGGEMKGGI
jgi:hypothetical protein